MRKFARRPAWPSNQFTAAIRAYAAQGMFRTAGAERALEGTDPRVDGTGGQVLVATFAIRSEGEHRRLQLRLHVVCSAFQNIMRSAGPRWITAPLCGRRCSRIDELRQERREDQGVLRVQEGPNESIAASSKVTSLPKSLA